MDLSFVNSHLAKDVTRSPWMTGAGSPATRPDDSFAEHLQFEPLPATGASASRAAPPVENAPADSPPCEEQDPQAVDDPTESEEEAAAAVALEEPSATQVDPSDTAPMTRQAADEPAVAAEKTRQSAERSEHADAAASAKQAGTRDVDSTASDPAGRASAPQNSAQPSPVQQPATVPVDRPTRPTHASVPLQSPADVAVVTEAATDAALAAEDATTTSAATAATEKSSGKLKAEKPSLTARSTGALQRAAAAAAELAPTTDAAAATAVDLHLANRVADMAAAEPGAAEQGADQASNTSVQEGDARTQTSQRTHTLTERSPEQLFVRGTAGPAAAHELPQADQQRLIQRVARAMEAASQRGGILRLRLRPPELGSLRLEVSLQDGNLSARIETETQATKSLLLDQLPQLRDRLAERGFHVAQFDVDVSEQHAGDTPFEPPDAEHSLPVAPARHRTTDATELPEELAPNPFVYAQPGKLNVVI